jgi:hypothetical protein
MDRMMHDEIAMKYPDQWVGLSEVVYRNNDGITVDSAVVVFTDKNKSELAMMAIKGEGIIPWFTTPNNTFHLGGIGRAFVN